MTDPIGVGPWARNMVVVGLGSLARRLRPVHRPSDVYLVIPARSPGHSACDSWSPGMPYGGIDAGVVDLVLPGEDELDTPDEELPSTTGEPTS